jgi:hypothetical protein
MTKKERLKGEALTEIADIVEDIFLAAKLLRMAGLVKEAEHLADVGRDLSAFKIALRHPKGLSPS